MSEIKQIVLKIWFLSCFNCITTLSPVRSPGSRSGVVGPRQFYRDSRNWIDTYTGNHQIKIVYAIEDKFSDWQKDYIREQFQKLTSNTCLKTQEYRIDDEECNEFNACVRFWKTLWGSCETRRWSRNISLPTHCFNDQWVLHEILHVLGFGHEHQRSDRDCYVEVTGPGLTDPQYAKRRDIDISFPYDVHSIMHYRRDHKMGPAKSDWKQDREFGSRDELTEMDVIALNYMFCGGRHYCDINPVRCQYFQCWIECNPCSEEPVGQCKNCTGNTYG